MRCRTRVAHSFARVIGSAIRAAASPGDPGQAFASAFLDDVFRQVGAPVTGVVGGSPTPEPGAVAPAGGIEGTAPIATTPENPVPTVHGHPPAVDGTALAGNAAPAIPPSDPFSTIRDDAEPTRRELLAEQLGVPVESIVDVGLLDYAGRSADVLQGFVEGAGFSALATGEALVEIARSPRQFIDGVKTLLSSSEARAQFGNEIVMRVKVDLQMLEDAFNSGDMRGTGQQLGKLTTDLAQVAGGVEALARLGVSAGSAGGRLLLGAVDELANASLLKVPSLFDAAGKPLMDFRALTSAQKGVVGETLGAALVKEILPDGQRLSRAPMIGQTGIDDLYKVVRPDVDFVMVEYKFGSSRLGATADGLQLSDGWLRGSVTGNDRIVRAIGADEALVVDRSMNAGRVEKWLVHIDPFGNATVALVDRSGKNIVQPTSKLFGGKP